MKKLWCFDLDGTLTESKQKMSLEISLLLSKLAEIKKIAIISGASFAQFEEQMLSRMKWWDEEWLTNLILLPTNGSKMYIRENKEWSKIYSKDLSSRERIKILDAFEDVLHRTEWLTPRQATIYGQLIEDRGSQITFSALGQEAPLDEKIAYDPDHKIRMTIKKELEPLLPEYEIKIGGTTSIDVTKKGIDKAFGIRMLNKHLSIPDEEILFVGDALFEGGNDHSVLSTGVKCIPVSGPTAVSTLIRGEIFK